MNTTRSILLAIAVATGCALPARGEFVRGNIYVTVSTGEPSCFEFGDPSAIVEINPETGDMRVFAHSDDHEMCVPSGLRFTPDGEHLLLLEWWWSTVLSFDADGSSEILYGPEDGLDSPMGANGLAFDAQENLYVVNRFEPILRFPADGGIAEPFASLGNGALDFAANGDLFHALSTSGSGPIIRIDPNGVGIVFDDPPGTASSLAFERAGNLFAASGNSVYRYDNADPRTRRVLASGFLHGGVLPIAASGDGLAIYVAEIPGLVHAVDPKEGTITPIADIRDLFWWGAIPAGMTIYAPRIGGDANGDGDVDLDDFVIFDGCVGAPGKVPPIGCEFADLDADQDVDWADFALFQVVFAGPSQ